jgi:nucleoside-diphosphate-sugar epimerase
MKENKLQVIFGTGPLGMSVMRELVQQGQIVKMVNRSGKAPQGVPTLVEVLGGDGYNLDFTRRVCAGASVVYQCAQPQYWEWAEKFPPLQASILEGAASAGAKLVVGENLYMYGEVTGPIHEGLPYAAQTRKGRVRAAMSQALLEAHRTGKVEVAIARGSDFYGPLVLDSALGERAILPALQGKNASLGGSLDLPHTYTYIDDFGKAMAILGSRHAALGQAWHVPNPPTRTQQELMTLFFNEIGKPPKMSSVSKGMMRLAGIFIPGARETVEMMYEFEKPFVVDSSKFIRAFGDISTPHQQAVRETLAWFREHLN